MANPFLTVVLGPPGSIKELLGLWVDPQIPVQRRVNFLKMHRAIANARNILLEHATVILTAQGQPMEQGVVLDPWRNGGGELWYGRVFEDNRYAWEHAGAMRAWQDRTRTEF